MSYPCLVRTITQRVANVHQDSEGMELTVARVCRICSLCINPSTYIVPESISTFNYLFLEIWILYLFNFPRNSCIFFFLRDQVL